MPSAGLKLLNQMNAASIYCLLAKARKSALQDVAIRPVVSGPSNCQVDPQFTPARRRNRSHQSQKHGPAWQLARHKGILNPSR